MQANVIASAEDERIRGRVAGTLEFTQPQLPHRIAFRDPVCEGRRSVGTLNRHFQ